MILLAATLALGGSTVLYDFTMNDIDGKPQPLSQYKGKVVMAVNVASLCGMTPQYEALQATYLKYKEKGFVILGFPCNDFNSQEPGTESEIKKFCTTNYKVTFPMFSKLHVKGDEQAPLYKWLTSETGGKDVEWNFTKFLIGRDGKVIARFPSKVKPDDEAITSAIEAAIEKK